MKAITIKRTRHRLLPDARRVLAKPYHPGEELILPGQSRAQLLITRILAIPEAQIAALCADVLERFENRHDGFADTLERHFELVAQHIPKSARVTPERRTLIGAYFTHEYSVEAAALFNPSIVLAPDQQGVPRGASRFMMSLRAVGEGHLSSIEFRTGMFDAAGGITIDDASTRLVGGLRTAPTDFKKSSFRAKLLELGVDNALSARVLDPLADRFTLDHLETSLAAFVEKVDTPPAISFETVKVIRMLASSNYVTSFPTDTDPSERVIFPAGPHESHGMEDARFVRFTGEGGEVVYYATYTAYDGFEILPQLIETKDFARFTISTLNGAAAQNKGMALFPRRIGGKFVMLSRKDRENLHLSTSDDVHHWDDVTELFRPQNPWELMQIGNCGSPIETQAGWLVLTHGVGPMRRYAIGALLLDLEDPRRVLGYLPRPLLEPDEDEREGYVPNVVYTCGAIVHQDQLIIPYGLADSRVGIAQLALSELLGALRQHPVQRSGGLS
jgi:predicted GH43/DUF377 family glycosyl hydrolase